MRRVSEVLRRLVDGLGSGSGVRSLLSRSGLIGEKPDQTPGGFLLTHASGSRLFLEPQVTTFALREDVTGERILTFSWGVETTDILPFLTTHSANGGEPDGITYELLIPIDRLSGISRSTSPRLPITGISEVPCDTCPELVRKGEPYATLVMPPHQMYLLCWRCAQKGDTFG